MAAYKVIDVSDWQGKIDWVKVRKDGVVGAIIRYADGDVLDKRFKENMKGAKAAGIHVGSYIFSRASNKTEAIAEARRLYKACKPYSPDMPLYIDLEVRGLRKYADTVAAAFLKEMKSLGGRGGVYANLSWWNNYLTKTARNYSASPFWIAQYYSKMEYKNPLIMGMWQYSSSGKVNGIKGRVDMNRCYVPYWKAAPKKVKKHYAGEMPPLRLIKSNTEVRDDACKWAAWIAGDDRFHYGRGKYAHHNGCYFCGTQRLKKGGDLVDPEFTYCCHPFVTAAYAHGGCDPAALRKCQSTSSYTASTYRKSKFYKHLGKPKFDSLQAGDILYVDNDSECHYALYLGDGKMAEASGGDDNVRNSKRWNNSIHVKSIKAWGRFQGAFRYTGSVDKEMPIRHGEISDRVRLLQKYLVWYGCKVDIDGIFGDGTLSAVKQMQKALGIDDDGIVGADTLKKMAEVKR